MLTCFLEMSRLYFCGYKYNVVFWWKIRASHSDISFYGIPGHCVGPPGYMATSAIEYFTAAYKVRANDQSQTVKNAAMLGKFLTVRSLCALCQANTYRNICLTICSLITMSVMSYKLYLCHHVYLHI